MKHAVFALFPNKPSARAAVKEAQSEGLLRQDNLHVLMHDDPQHMERMEYQVESDMRPALKRGLIWGGIVGAVMGALLGGPLGLIAAGPLAGAGFGALGGAAYAALGATLSGASMPKPELDELIHDAHEGEVLVTFTLDHHASEHRVETIAAAHGAKVTRHAA